jgi:hypothetical protein
MPKLFELNSGVVERHQRYFVDLIQNCVENLAEIDGVLKPWLETVNIFVFKSGVGCQFLKKLA